MSADKVASDGKLKNLECLFTWDVDKDDINDLKGIPEKLLDRVEYCPRRYHATYFNILAFVSHLQGRNDTALEYLAKSEAVLKEEKQDEADFLVTYSSFAWLHHHLGNMEDMETYLGKVKRVGEGGETAVEAEKGWSFLRMGAKFYPRAKESFQKALEAKPDSVSYNVGYAIVLYRLEGLVRKDVRVKPKDSPAAKQLQRALDLDPTDAEVMVLLALKHQRYNPPKSRELVLTALEKCADMPQVIKYAGIYFRIDNSKAESLKILEEAAKRAPNSSFLYHQMGLLHWQEMIKMKTSGEWQAGSAQVKAASAESIRLFRKTVELKPSHTLAWVQLAKAYAESRQLEKAEPIFARLVSDARLTDAERQHCHTKYGVFLMYHRKDDTRAVEQFKKAYRIRVDSQDRSQARDKLKTIGRRKSGQRGRKSDDISAFLSAVDDQDRQDSATKAAAAATNVIGLADSFKTKMTL
ncbi:interferon-induced protein with tetratricopeptide repeats 5-like [Alosa sapidissima]|uniref:interferon-induced protein with tetratricopeptide repeats 5-like n=1 Tax=Alosa sapidissima TaxID=34773 RepID=UPI001C0A3533|nr:interferon-induced protein with tetratricopeptide repeats 5-like [Alosa sapidissima]